MMVLHELQFLAYSFCLEHQVRGGFGYIPLWFSADEASAAIGKASALFLVRIIQHKLRETVMLQPHDI